jgi:hypothetical protein
MTTTKFDWEQARDVARAVSRKLARSYPGIPADDIEQAILTRVAEQEALFKRMNYGEGALGVMFRKYGTKFANDERLSALNFNDQYHYTTAEVRALCGKALFDRDTFLATIEDNPDIVANFDEVMARVIDLQDAYRDASDADKAIIARRFGGETLTPAEAKAAQRAVDRLSLAINIGRSARRGDHSGPGARKAMSNAQAIDRTRYERDRG